ncbi:hypothetical protein N9D43_03135 [Luminiphilus sp.]|nr:hypothetical protein [Luminiphilus sp.]
MRACITVLVSVLVFSGCATVKEREMAALEKELGLDTAPYFPKCLSEEVAPRAAMRSGDYSSGVHTVNNPQGDVPIDRCARWETNEPPGKSKDKPEKLILTPPPEKTDSRNEEVVETG